MPRIRIDKVLKCGREILRRMYLEATPSADFEFLVETFKDTGNETWMERFVLRKSRQMGIVEVEAESEKLTKAETIWMLQQIKGMLPVQEIGQRIRREEKTLVSLK